MKTYLVIAQNINFRTFMLNITAKNLGEAINNGAEFIRVNYTWKDPASIPSNIKIIQD